MVVMLGKYGIPLRTFGTWYIFWQMMTSRNWTRTFRSYTINGGKGDGRIRKRNGGEKGTPYGANECITCR